MHFALAREADVGLVFRRGPARWVRAIRWDTQRDTFEPGQWFHGRIYEERCDLSPDGELLVYFAYKGHRAGRVTDEGKRPHLEDYRDSWTAVSRPPWLTALALWPKGDTWMGGGVFTERRELLLFHPYENRSHGAHRPTQLRVACIDGPLDVTRPVRPTRWM